MFNNLFRSNIAYLFLIFFFNFIHLNAEAKNLSLYKTHTYNIKFNFVVDSKLNNYKLARLDNNIKEPVVSINSSYNFSDFGLDDELNDVDEPVININDPFESINRKSFGFSMWLNRYIFQYIADAYVTLVAQPIRMSFLSAINNFNEPISIVNHLLQFKVISFTKTTARFFINSTLGLFGFIDVASKLNLPPNYNDFAYTLSYYKIGDGFYIFVPLFGPYTLQTAISDITASYAYSITVDKLININSVVSLGSNIAQRALPYIESELYLSTMLNASEDPYTLVKSAYIQARKVYLQKLIHSW